MQPSDLNQIDLNQIDPVQWELPTSYQDGLRVPVRIFATEALLEPLARSEAMAQAVRVAMLPGLVGHVVLMPDAHAGRGAPFGLVAAMKHPVGAIVPGAIGRDINCGVRLLSSDVKAEEVGDLEALVEALRAHVPVGADAEGALSLTRSEVDHIAKSGAQWALRRGMAEQDDLVRAEEGGRLNEADPARVSDEARALGARQLGTLGGGDHFIEVSVVEEVVDRAAAITMKLREGRLAVLVHSGSRGYGRKICADYIEQFRAGLEQQGQAPPDPELAYASLEDTKAGHYMEALRAAANFAYANRQVLAHRVREAFGEVREGSRLRTVYDVAHNLGRMEVHDVGGRQMQCYVHRKGAARAFGPGTPGISLPYRALGQPALLPGRAGQDTWVMLGTRQSMTKSFGSVCHAAAPSMSRRDAHHTEDAGGAVQVQEDVEAVVQTLTRARLARQVARLRPVAVVRA